MKKKPRESLDLYYREADSWANDRQQMLRASRRTAWIVAGVATMAALAEALALMFLAPLKTVEPYTLLVDRQTGFVEALKPLDAQKIAPDTALTRSFLVQYVIARESFDIATLQSDYRKVSLWTADPARSAYTSAMQAANPASPLARLPRSALITTRVKSVSWLGGHAALVRFDTQRQDANASPEPARAWIAVIRYRFSTEPLSVEDRYVNPLGFQVVSYRRDQETLPAASEPGAAPTPAPTPLPGLPPRAYAPPPGQPNAPAPRPQPSSSPGLEVTL